jgi:hypothetical protein
MAQYIRKIKEEFQEKKPWQEMKVAELKAECEVLDIVSSGTKDELLQRLKDYEAGKYTGPVQYVSVDKPKIYLVGVHLNDVLAQKQLAALLQKGEAFFHHYSTDYYFYSTPEKIKLV